MIRFSVILFCLCFPTLVTRCQKPVLDSAAIKGWPALQHPVISSDGRFLMYEISNRPTNFYDISKDTLTIQAVEGAWRREYPGFLSGGFSADNRKAILSHKDTLFLLDLVSGEQKQILVNQYRHIQAGVYDWLVYEPKKLLYNRELVLLDLMTSREHDFKNVSEYKFDADGRSVFFLIEVKDSSAAQKLICVDIESGISKQIWPITTRFKKTARIRAWNIDKTGQQLSFLVTEDSESQPTQSVFYYKKGMDSAELRVNQHTSGMGGGVSISSGPAFSSDGRWLMFKIDSPIIRPKSSAIIPSVDIWSYRDVVIIPEQQRLLGVGGTRQNQVTDAFVRVTGGPVIRPTHDNIYLLSMSNCYNDYVIMGSGERNAEPWWPRELGKWSVYIQSLVDGKRQLLYKGGKYGISGFSLSPGGNWLLYYNVKQGSYCSYEFNTGKIRNITAGVGVLFRSEYGSLSGSAGPIAGWLSNDKAVLLYDNYDIWQVDPAGVKKAINITNGYGVKHRIKLRIMNGPEGEKNKLVFTDREELTLVGFSPVTKYNGFFNKILGEAGNPVERYMGPYTFFRVGSQKAHFYSFDDGMQPIAAEKAGVWLVKRQSDTEAPNYYLTKDFTTFKALTNVQPQKEYNWLKAELHDWRLPDGTISQGILYKPENFDPKVKYPVLFNYYEQLSHRLYEYPIPAFTEANINIPWFVSRGYLVFTPDIHYKVGSLSGKPVGEWACEAVVSAARYLSQLPYVDSRHMGIQGHSFGGGETNYIVTHSHLFAAAAEVAGNSDLVSAYLTLVPFAAPFEHFSKQTGAETGQGRYGATLWERPELYLKGSAVLHTDRVTTPLLIMHNQRDNQIQWRQGLELYMALRRLGKKSWMLQYDNGGHTVSGPDAIDYTTRLTQFFDYYLKGVLPPKWMTQGVLAAMKGIDSGLELDKSGAIP